MRKFLLSLIDSNNPNSSKRFAGLSSLFATISLAIAATVKMNGVCPEFMFNGLLLLAAGAFAINGMENVFRHKDNASQLPKENEPVVAEPPADSDSPVTSPKDEVKP